MFTALKELPVEQERDILGRLSQSLLPHPFAEPEDFVKDLPAGLRERVLEEARQRLKIRRGTSATEADAMISAFLARQITESVLRESDRDKIRARLGERGDLPLVEFSIQFAPDFVEKSANASVRRGDAEQVVRDPLMFEHLLTEKSSRQGMDALSMFVGRIVNPDRDPFLLFVIATRFGSRLVVQSAWRLYLSDISMPDVERPTDVLRRFVDAFGVDINVGDLPKTRFVIYHAIPALGRGKEALIVRVDNLVKLTAIYQFMLMRVNKSRVEISLAFALDVTRYQQSLRAHGVHIDR